ncbi:MAG: MBL fold metallo-hydrolase [Spirochaetes bacterium]|nr:MAG: MBL fold metallo-hydrolase [Spirochaetota bacterium]
MIERIIVGLMYTNAYIFSFSKKECIVLDPGGDTDEIIERLNRKNLTPVGIVCTHGHLDHIGGVGQLKKHFMESGHNIKVAIHEADKHFTGKKAERAHRKSFARLGVDNSDLIDNLLTPIPEPEILLKEGMTVFNTDLKVIHTPGHTPGSICLYSENQSLVFSGDTLFFEGVGRTDLPEGDHEALLRSIREKLFVLPELTRVFPGHGPDTTIEREIKHNPFIN